MDLSHHPSPESRSYALRLGFGISLGLTLMLALSGTLLAADSGYREASVQVCIPVEFILFGLTLAGVALFDRYTLSVSLLGLGSIVGFKLAYTGFAEAPGWWGLGLHFGHEWVLLANLLGLLLGFALLARHFEDSRIPEALPRFLPDGWLGGFVLLAMIFVLSSFLDNIAAALIGGTIAAGVYRYRVHIGYLAAIVAASNAGGSGSVVGDTTTTMMWISGVAPSDVLNAYVAAGAALLVFGIPASIQQARHAKIERTMPVGVRIDWARLWIVLAILAAAVTVNLIVNLYFGAWADSFPFLGLTVMGAILATARVRKPEWSLLPEALKGSIFLLALTFAASMMPVEQLPAASWVSTFGIGFVSAVFNNIPLTALALQQGGYDWPLIAFAVGFGGSMIWFGSSAGVAISSLYPEAKSTGLWLREGWHVTLAYVLGFAAMMLILGWQPKDAALRGGVSANAGQAAPVCLRGCPAPGSANDAVGVPLCDGRETERRCDS